jgi:hypothetical protein
MLRDAAEAVLLLTYVRSAPSAAHNKAQYTPQGGRTSGTAHYFTSLMLDGCKKGKLTPACLVRPRRRSTRGLGLTNHSSSQLQPHLASPIQRHPQPRHPCACHCCLSMPPRRAVQPRPTPTCDVQLQCQVQSQCLCCCQHWCSHELKLIPLATSPQQQGGQALG